MGNPCQSEVRPGREEHPQDPPAVGQGPLPLKRKQRQRPGPWGHLRLLLPVLGLGSTLGMAASHP